MTTTILKTVTLKKKQSYFFLLIFFSHLKNYWIQYKVCGPLFRMIYFWISDGVLEDPFGEFFISINDNVGASNLWFEKYKLRVEMMVPFISEQLSNKVCVLFHRFSIKKFFKRKKNI